MEVKRSDQVTEKRDLTTVIHALKGTITQEKRPGSIRFSPLPGPGEGVL
jgi:hypothetical protein